MDGDKVAQLLSENTFHFAKSMPKIPHAYTRGREWKSQSEFLSVAEYIHTHGVPEKFWKKTYYYFYANDHKYWVMDDDPIDVEIINRAKV
jgi:hypothetical protein